LVKNPVVRYVGKRLLAYIVTLWGAFTIAFFAFHLVPGNPIGAYISSLAARYSWSVQGAGTIIEEYKKKFGLDADLFTQYVNYLKELILNGNMGPSFLAFPTPTQVLILRALPWTIILLSESILISWVLGNIIGALIGWRRGSKVDSAISSVALALQQVPFYILAIVLILAFAYIFGTLPPMGAFSQALSPGLTLEFILSVMYHAILPSLSLVLAGVAGWIISMRSLVVSIVGEDYLRLAEAKGLKRARILMRYAFRNALLPQITGLAMAIGFMLNGFFLVEYLFRYPGLGRLFVEAINNLDYNVLQGIVLLMMFSVITANLLIDLLYPLIDPRIRYGGK